MGQRQRRRAGLRQSADTVADHEHPVATQPVTDGPADQEQQHDRQRTRREGEAEVTGVAGRLQHGEGEADRGHRRTEQGGRACGQQQPEAAVPQRSPPIAPHHGSHVGQLGQPVNSAESR